MFGLRCASCGGNWAGRDRGSNGARGQPRQRCSISGPPVAASMRSGALLSILQPYWRRRVCRAVRGAFVFDFAKFPPRRSSGNIRARELAELTPHTRYWYAPPLRTTASRNFCALRTHFGPSFSRCARARRVQTSGFRSARRAGAAAGTACTRQCHLVTIQSARRASVRATSRASSCPSRWRCAVPRRRLLLLLLLPRKRGAPAPRRGPRSACAPTGPRPPSSHRPPG